MTTQRNLGYGLGWALIAGLFASAVLAATPPSSVNYQGVLRDQNDAPLTGSFDMVLYFMDADTGGNEILVDQHTVATSNPVSVSDGLFSVPLGSGTVGDGSGPGTYASLAEVFRDHDSVWLEVRVGAETLSPRTRIHSSPYALNAAQLDGHPASDFLDTFTPEQTKNGQLKVVTTVDNGRAVFGEALDGVGLFGNAELGVVGNGTYQGGSFTGRTWGLIARTYADASAITAGRFEGFFSADAVHGLANAGDGGQFESNFGIGVRASGVPGGQFTTPSSGMTVKLAQAGTGVDVSGGGAGSVGVQAAGGNNGGIFSASDAGSYGVRGIGQAHGGFFQNAGTEYAYAASQGVGIFSVGPTYGSYFANGSPWFSYAYIPSTYEGIHALGATIGGEFNNFSSSSYALVGYSTYKIVGIGSMSFVQNHPQDPSKVIVYAAPEGDEVAVYTRGSGKLAHGEARVKLGETFALVTNPDIGLTATATPRGEPIPLAIDELTAGEMIVRGPAGSNAEFDYMVWGLRIGFEEQSIVQPKQRESKIPSMNEHEEFFQKDPALRGYTALARFADGEEKVRGRSAVNLERAHRLRDAVGVFPQGSPLDEPREGPGRLEPPLPAGMPASSAAAAAQAPEQPLALPVALPSGGLARQPLDDRDLFDVVGPIVAGDVVSLVAGSPGAVVLSAGPDDDLVIGCAQESEIATPGRVGVATSRIALCRVDASFGAVAVGDRLTASPVPGTAMRAAPDAPAAAALGRAIDPLDSGADVIRVLVSPR